MDPAEEPLITAAVVKPNTTPKGTELAITGMNFPTDEECEVSYAEARSTSCTVLSDGSIEASFPKGIPTSQDGEEPVVTFTKPEASVPASLAELRPVVIIAPSLPDKENIIVPNPVVIDPASTPESIPSSYEGGAPVVISVPGLAEKIAQGNAEVLVCDKECKFMETESSAEQVTCETPPIRTVKSNERFNTEEIINLCIDGFASETSGK